MYDVTPCRRVSKGRDGSIACVDMKGLFDES